MKNVWWILVLIAFGLAGCPSPSSSGNSTGPSMPTLRFDANGGSSSMASIQGAAGSVRTLPACTFGKVGFTFLGWATSSADAVAGKPSYIDQDSYTFGSSDATLYAVWAAVTVRGT